jgi:Fe2+ transport system protein FeoA
LEFNGLFDISNTMSIVDAPLQTTLVVRSFHKDETRDLSDLESRLMHLGFFYGEKIKITHRAPLFKEPFLIEVRGRSVALSKDEAALVSVEVHP